MAPITDSKGPPGLDSGFLRPDLLMETTLFSVLAGDRLF
jgi:hypothetical protein